MRLTGLIARLILGGALVATQAGCLAIPPAITIASLGVDFGSFALTGKTASDHVLSAVAGEDCRMLGVLEGEICQEEQAFETALAVLEPLPDTPEQAIPPVLQAKTSLEPPMAAEQASSQSVPQGFKLPSGTVVSEDPELPVGGFADGGDRIPVSLATASAPVTPNAAEQAAERLEFSGYLSDVEMLRGAPVTSAIPLGSLGGAVFLAQAGPGLVTDSHSLQE